MIHRRWLVPGLLLVGAALLLSQLCLKPGDAPAWRLEHLRALDRPENLPPDRDLTALYARPAGLNCEIRLDFLDLPSQPAYDLRLFSGGRSYRFQTGSEWVTGYDSQAETITLQLPGFCPAGEFRAETASDSLSSSNPSLFSPVQLSLVFSNAFDAYTPAQTLRAWDGAHTGPRGERHGLRHLLTALEKYQTPLTLLNVNNPQALSALAYADGLKWVTRLEQSGLISLPRRPDSPWLLEDVQPDPNGLPLANRRELLESAGRHLAWGGAFDQSTWGAPEMVTPALAYLAARPYIEWTVAPHEKLYLAPQDPAGEELSWLDAQAHTHPLGRLYASQAALLRAAHAWLAHPYTTTNCSTDLDQDARPECILSNQHWFAVIDLRGGRLEMLFHSRGQVIGSMAQFFVGLSDSSEWQPEAGDAADPALLMGAFADDLNPFLPYQPAVSTDGSLTLNSSTGQTKTYRLDARRLFVELSAPQEISTRIPLAFLPERRFQPAWATAYQLDESSNRLALSLRDGPGVSIHSKQPVSWETASFLGAHDHLRLPEDPNASVPAGMHIPFPLVVVKINGFTHLELIFELKGPID